MPSTVTRSRAAIWASRWPTCKPRPATSTATCNIWVYDSPADREAKRQALQKDPAWADYLKISAEAAYLISQENQLMTPVSFFKP